MKKQSEKNDKQSEETISKVNEKIEIETSLIQTETTYETSYQDKPDTTEFLKSSKVNDLMGKLPPMVTKDKNSLQSMSINVNAKKPTEAELKEMNILDQIYYKLDSMFATSDSQMFSMEFPGRVLHPATYAYDSDNVNAQLTKPQTVIEQEFRLTNDLFDVSVPNGKQGDCAQLVAGGSGVKMTDMYALALNILVPKWAENEAFKKDQSKIRSWMMESVEDIVDGESVKCTRIEMFEKLNSRYLNKKADWEYIKYAKMENARKSENQNEALEEYARWLAHEAPVYQSAIDNCFADLVLRGYYHEVKGYMAYLDVMPISEQMYEAKSVLRHCSMSALDESQTIYPVQMQPADWFRALNTDFTSQDLTLDPVFLRNTLIEKEIELETVEYELGLLMSQQTDYEEKMASLQSQINDAHKVIDEEESRMMKLFNRSVCEAIKIAIKTLKFKTGNKSTIESVVTEAKSYLTGASGAGALAVLVTPEAVDFIADSLDKISEQQLAINSASRNLSQLLLAKAEAETLRADKEIKMLNINAITLRKEVEYLRIMVYGNAKSENPEFKILNADVPDKVVEFDNLPAIPSMPPPSRWVDIIMDFSSKSYKTESRLMTAAYNASMRMMFGFTRSYGDASISGTDYFDAIMNDQTKIKLGFRVTKVMTDRGWFRPQFFNMTEDMYKIAAGTISSDPVKKKDILPAYPIGFIVVKDVTIHFDKVNENKKDVKQMLESTCGSSGGFLCFSAQARQTSKIDRQAFSWSYEKDRISIRIPGPQILGWFLNRVPKDPEGSKTNYQPLPQGYQFF